MADGMVEKIYCNDRPYGGGCDPMAMAAILNNGGMNGGWNNPFVYLVWMMFANRFFGNGWENGQGQQNIEVQNQLQAIRTQMQDNQNSNLLMDAVKGVGADINQLAQSLNCDFNALNGAICDVRGGIDRLSGQIGTSSERVINSVLNGNLQLTQALKDCCCQTQQAIQRMGYENQLGQKDIINSMLTGFDRTNTGMERGFAQVGYDTQKQTCDIIAAGNANTQRIIDTLNNHWTDEKSREIQDLKFQLSQERQNNFIGAKISAAIGGCTGNPSGYGI